MQDNSSQDKFSRQVGSGLTGFGLPEESAPRMSDGEMLSAMNVPPRDESEYPDLPEQSQIEAGSFLSKLNLIAATYDGNLQSLLWEFYDKLSRYLTTETKAEDLIALVGTMDRMKGYLLSSRNPILFPPEENSEESPSGTQGGQEFSDGGKGL